MMPAFLEQAIVRGWRNYFTFKCYNKNTLGNGERTEEPVR